jgi:branched-chain amino acid transport system substrate-binding protein
MRLKMIIALVVAMMMVTLGFASCGGGGDGGTKVTVKIGLTAPLSGIGAGYGLDVKEGLEMAINDVNSDGGLTIGDTTYIFELVPADDATNPEAALANAQGFVLEEGINIIFDPYATTIIPLLGINQKAGEEFLVMAYTSVPLYTDAPNPYMVTEPPPFYVYIPDFIKSAMGQGYTRMGMLQTTGSYGELWGSTFKEAWTGAGGTVVAEAPASYYTETDFTPYLTTLLAANPDVIFAGGPSYPTALIIEQARGLGFTGGFILMDQAKMDEVAEVTGMEALNGTTGVLPVELTTFGYTKTFIDRYQEEYGEMCTWETCINYTAFRILVRAMKAAGSVDDLDAIRAAFADEGVAVTTAEEKMPVEYEGFQDSTGALLMPGQACIVQNGQFVAGETINWWQQ